MFSLSPRCSRATDTALIVVFLLVLLAPFHSAVAKAPPGAQEPYPYTLTEEAHIPFQLVGRVQHNSRRYFVLEDANLVAYALDVPGNASWELDLNTSLCVSMDGGASSGSSGPWSQSYGSEWKELSSIDDERLLVYCGPNLVLVNATNGSVIATHRFVNGDLVLFHASTSQYTTMMELSPSGRVVSFDLRTLRERWWLQGNPNDATLLGGANGVAVIVDLFSDTTGAVQGFDAVSGRLLWNVSMPKWPTWGGLAFVTPIFSDSILAWFGPEAASVRTVYFPTGAYWQYIARFTIQLIRPTNDGRLLVALVSSIIALSVVNQTVLWERTVPFPVYAMSVSADNGYVMVQADGAAGLPTLVLSMADGSRVGDCGDVHCSYSCVLGMPALKVVLLLNCSGGNGAALRAVDPVTRETVSSPLLLADVNQLNRAQLEPLSSDVVAVTGPSVRIVRVTAPPMSSSRPGAGSQWIAAAAALATALALVVVSGTMTLYWRRYQRRPSPPPAAAPSAPASVQEALVVADDTHDDALQLRAALTV